MIKSKEELDYELCSYCDFTKESHHPETLCEGSYCDEAYENYLDEIHLNKEEGD